MKVFLVGAGDTDIGQLKILYNSFTVKPVLIAVDGGLKAVEAAGLKADFAVGDFDSFTSEESPNALKGVPFERLSTEKDDTDSEHAMRKAISLSPDTVYMFGMTGTRLDHTISNVYLLSCFENAGIDAFIINKTNRIRVVTSDPSGRTTVTLSERERFGKYISILPLTDVVSGLTIRNAKYELSDYTLTRNVSRCISNESLGKDIEVEFNSGSIIIIESMD